MAVEVRGRYQGELTCEVIHGPSENALNTTAPKDNGGKGTFFSPSDLCASALGTCMATIVGIYATKHEFELGDLSFKVEKHMTSAQPRQIERLVADINLSSQVPEDKRERLEEAARNCPVALSLNPSIKMETTFSYS